MTAILETLAERQAALLDRYEHGEDERDQAATAKIAEVDAFLDSVALVLNSYGAELTRFKTTGGQDTWFYVVNKKSWLDIRPDGLLGTAVDTHEAFLENGVEKNKLYISAFYLSEKNGEVVSQPDSSNLISDKSYDAAVNLCANTQIAEHPDAHRLMSNWDWSLIYHLMVADQKTTESNYKGLFDFATHNDSISGVELRDGEIFIAADNGDATDANNYISTGYYYSSNTSNNYGVPHIISDLANIIRNPNHYDTISGNDGFVNLNGDSSILLKRACLAPIKDGSDAAGSIAVKNYGIRRLLRGDYYEGIATLDFLRLNNSNFGFVRSAFTA